MKRRWPEPYVKLTDAMYHLRREFPSPILLASSVVNPRHSIPPEQLRLLDVMAGTDPIKIPSLLRLLGRWMVCVFSGFYDTASILFLKFAFRWKFRRKFGAPVAALFKTWTPGVRALANENDFYFGSLPQRLRDKEVSAYFLTGDATSDDGQLFAKFKNFFRAWTFVSAVLNRPSSTLVPEILLINVFAPLSVAVRQIFVALALRDRALESHDRLKAALAAEGAIDVLRPYTTKNAMYWYIGRNAVRRWAPRAFTTLYEGQPWEKLAWLGAKEVRPKIIIGGYQHTVIMPHAQSLVNPIKDSWEKATPDVIMCTGEETLKIMEPGHRMFGTRFVTFGSFRRTGTDGAFLSPRPGLKTVLVLPEGILTEAEQLFDASLNLAEELPDYRFIFRCHPVLPFEKVAPHLKKNVAGLKNVEVSRNPVIQTDFERSSTLLYRGSSAVLYAVLAGVKPICLLQPDGINVDPLNSLSGWRVYASSEDEIERALRGTEDQPGPKAQDESREAARYINAYVQPVTDEAVDALIKALLPDGKFV